MQKTLPKLVAAGAAPVVSGPDGEPDSLIVRALPNVKAPGLCCLQALQAVFPGQPFSPAHWASDVQGTCGFFQLGANLAAQNPQKTKGWLGRSADWAVDVPVVSANGIGSTASGGPELGGSQSWLVGNASPVLVIVPGVHG
jgi:hypothetical protein